MSRVDVSRLTDDDHPAWEAVVADHALATPFHTLAWKRAVEATFDYAAAHRTIRDDGDITAVVPTFDCGGLVGSTLVNPFCEYGFPLVTEGADVAHVISALGEFAGRTRTVFLKDVDWSGVTGYNAAGFGGVETGTVRRLPLPTDFETLATTVFDRSLRQNVESAIDAGVSVSETTDVSEFYAVYLATMRRRGSPQFPRSFFEALLDTFGEQATLLVATRRGSVVAGLLALDHVGRRFLFVGGSDADHWDVRPNDLLYREAVRQACERGYDLVDFGRSEPGSGVDRFKRRFGGRSSRLTTLVAPPHRTSSASVSGYRALEPLARRLAPLVTHPAVGPRLKETIHE